MQHTATLDYADYVLIGGGLASATAATTIRKRDPHGSILIIGGEPRAPYNRPPLSKEFLRGEVREADIQVTPAATYADQRIILQTGIRAIGIDTASKTVQLDLNRSVRYNKVCLATGSKAKRPAADEMPGANAANVYTLRTLSDAGAIRPHLQAGRRVVIIGAGYIGMEVAAVCCQRGLQVTVVSPAPHPWDKFASPAFGAFLRAYYEAQGVQFRLETHAEQIMLTHHDHEGPATGVRISAGEILPCDFVVLGVGASLNLDVAKAAGLDVDDKQGVRVNEYLETSAPDVWAAGDIACFHDPVLDKEWHIEHWQNALWHGEIVGANMAGGRIAYDHVPWFFSDEFDLHMTLRGDPQAGKSSFTIGDMSAQTDRFLEVYLREDGTLAMGLLVSKAADETPTADLLERLIRARVPVAPYRDALVNGSQTLESLLA